MSVTSPARIRQRYMAFVMSKYDTYNFVEFSASEEECDGKVILLYN